MRSIFGDTWEWDGTDWTLRLSVQYQNQRPLLGASFVIATTGLASGSTAFLYFGFSKTLWGSVPLPLDLTTYGAPGCTLYLSPDLLLSFPSGSGSVLWTLPIPSNPWLLGQRFYNQAWVPDPGVNPLGVAVSNAAEAVLGSR